jgi:glyoxylase I family protein
MTTTNFFEMSLAPRDKADDPGTDQLPLSLHHSAVPVRDMGVTRAFMENIRQMPMVACWTEATVMPESNRTIPYCHTFFALADGSNVAYFQFADPEYAEKVFLKVGPEINRFYHLALRTTRAYQIGLIERLKINGIAYRITNHGYVKSLYVTSPDGVQFEFANAPPDEAKVNELGRTTAHAALARWMAGDHDTLNNPFRGRDF